MWKKLERRHRIALSIIIIVIIITYSAIPFIIKSP